MVLSSIVSYISAVPDYHNITIPVTKVTNENTITELRSCVKVEVAVLGSPVPNSPYGLCGRKVTLDSNLNTTRSWEKA